MRSEYPLPVRYVLYTHYPEGYDWEEYNAHETPPPVATLEGVQFLADHLSGLRGLLTWPGYEGLLVIFYSPGLDKFLKGVANRRSIKALRRGKELEFAKAVNDYINGLMEERYPELLPRLRFFTALDLHPVFGRIRNSDIADRLRTWIMGDTKGLRYDSPKMIEAIVRLRLLGSDVPVFRVDYDVLLRGKENCKKKNLEFSSTIGSCLTAYQLRRDSPHLSSFIFSASYDHKVLNEPEHAADFHKWGQAYATRVFPALPFDHLLIKETIQNIEECRNNTKDAKDISHKKNEREITAQAWDCYAAKAFNLRLADRFFGLNAQKFPTATPTGIGEIGAHPMASVISGAMLYMSDGAILDLPPFSNFSLNVGWIDDHLKYCLHRELRHLRRPKLGDDVVRGQKPRDLLTYAKIDEVVMQKAGRKIDKDLRQYIFDVYLPTLLRGTILDAWITPDPLLKYRPEGLTEENREYRRRLLNRRRSRGVLPAALRRALAACDFTSEARFVLETKLEDCALKRISQVRRQWATLSENGTETFASVWAKGLAAKFCDDLELKYCGLVRDTNVPVTAQLTADDLSNAITRDLTRLVADACNYIDWTRKWPTIVQVVRSIEQGTLKTDLNYIQKRQAYPSATTVS